MENKDKIKRKAGVVLVVLLMVTISVSSVLGGTVTNTDVKTTTTDTSLEINYAGGWINVVNMTLETDNQLTRIVNSNGKSWAATGANIQLAINDINDTAPVGDNKYHKQGDVWIPAGVYSMTDSIIAVENVSIHFGWSELLIDGDYPAIEMFPHSMVEQVIINVTGAGYSSTTAAIKFYDPAYINRYDEGFDYARNRFVKDVSIVSSGHTGIGISLYPDNRGANTNDMAWNHVENIKFFYLDTALLLKSDHNYNYVNFNTFINLYGKECTNFIVLNATGNEVAGNTFEMLKYEAESYAGQKAVILLTGNSRNNYFRDFATMDWGATNPARIKLEETAVHTAPGINTHIKVDPSGNVFAGSVDKDFPGQRELVDDDSMLDGYHMNNTYDGQYSLTIRSLNVSSGQGSEFHGINPGVNNGINGISFFQKTPVNPYRYIYGNVAGSDMYGADRIDSAGNWDFITQSGNMQFAPSTNIVEIDNTVHVPNIDTASGGLNITSDDSYTRVTGDLNVTGILSPTLFLIPVYGDPPIAIDGMMYFNTGNNSLVVYYDGAWHYHEED